MQPLKKKLQINNKKKNHHHGLIGLCLFYYRHAEKHTLKSMTCMYHPEPGPFASCLLMMQCLAAPVKGELKVCDIILHQVLK